MAHIALVVEAECRFGITFRTAEIEALRRVGDLVRLIEAKRRRLTRAVLFNSYVFLLAFLPRGAGGLLAAAPPGGGAPAALLADRGLAGVLRLVEPGFRGAAGGLDRRQLRRCAC